MIEALLTVTLFVLLLVLPFLYVARNLYGKFGWIVQILIGVSFNILTFILLLFMLSLTDRFDRVSFIVSYLMTVISLNGYFFIVNMGKGSISKAIQSAFKALTEYIREHFRFREYFCFRRDHCRESLLLFGIMVFAVILRFYDAISRSDLSNIDAYNHYLMSIDVMDGEPHDVFTPYNRGFHLLIIAIHWLSGISVYECVRFAGPILCSLSVPAVYVLVKEVTGRRPAQFATLLYGCVTMGNTLLHRQTISLSEAPVFLLMPVALIFVSRLETDLGNGRVVPGNVMGFLVPAILIALVHPISAMYFQYVLALFVLLQLLGLWYTDSQATGISRKVRLRKSSAGSDSTMGSSLRSSGPSGSLTIFIAVLLLVMPAIVAGHALLSKEFTGNYYNLSFEDSAGNGNSGDGSGNGGPDDINSGDADDGDNRMSGRETIVDIFSPGNDNIKDKVSRAVFLAVLFTEVVSLAAVVYFHRKESFTSFMAASVSLLGFVLLTGIGEPTLYRFRSSVYFIMFALVFWGVIVEKVVWKISGLLVTKLAEDPAGNPTGNLTEDPTDDLAGEVKNSSSFSRLISDHLALHSIALLLVFLILAAAAPRFVPGYTHLGYEDSVTITLDIVEDYPAEQVSIFSSDFGSMREQKIIEAHGGRYMNLTRFNALSPGNRTANLTAYNFFIIEKEPYPLDVSVFEESGSDKDSNYLRDGILARENNTEEIVKWLDRYSAESGTVEIYFESSDIIVYLIVEV